MADEGERTINYQSKSTCNLCNKIIHLCLNLQGKLAFQIGWKREERDFPFGRQQSGVKKWEINNTPTRYKLMNDISKYIFVYLVSRTLWGYLGKTFKTGIP